MSPWWWVLAGLAAWLAPGVVVVLMLGWTIVTVDILDLASPRIGSFRTNADAYRWMLQSFQGGVRIPPMPGR